jgi:UDPglucose 6-dehydrogenase
MGEAVEEDFKLIHMTIGFIGQGWIGKNYANDFEKRGYQVVRYALEPEYSANREKIRQCDMVFIAVPTPTTPAGFDDSIVRDALSLVGEGCTAVIKSTIVPGTTARLQADYPDIIVLYSPEFLSEATAAYDAANPFSNIIGLAADDEPHRAAAQKVLAVLPKAPFERICASSEAELIKYAHNLNGYFQIQLSNILYDAAQALGASWQNIEPAIAADPYISNRYSKPVHKTGRGAGGGCFIKDFAAFRETYGALVPDDARGKELLEALERKNIDLLKKSGKNLELLRGVYGEGI